MTAEAARALLNFHVLPSCAVRAKFPALFKLDDCIWLDLFSFQR
jgi:hypothetical protein